MKQTLYALLLGVSCASCQQAQHDQAHYKRVVLVGNSITYSAPNLKADWHGHWGMAASSPAHDYVHLLTAKLQRVEPTAQVKSQNIAEWERSYWKYDLTRLDTIKQYNPDLLIVRLGENINGDSLVQRGFATQFPALISHLAGPKTRTIVVGSFWGGEAVTAAMKQYCQEHNVQFVSLASLGEGTTYRAVGLYKDPGVASHPSDKGMEAITAQIWDSI